MIRSPAQSPPSFIPSPPVNGFHLGTLDVHFYGLIYVAAIVAGMLIAQRRWRAAGGEPDLVFDVALWAIPAGIIGARIYFDITTPFDIPHHWYGLFAIWDGGLGIWGGLAAGLAAGIWRMRRSGADWRALGDAAAPALLVAQAIGRAGNYFNQELYGKPTGVVWGLAISPQNRVPGYLQFTTFQPAFLYEIVFDLALAAALVWLGHHRDVRPSGLLALYVAGYSAYQIFGQSIRIDPSEHFLGLRLNVYAAILATCAGVAWLAFTQRGQRLAVQQAAVIPTDAGTSPAGGN